MNLQNKVRKLKKLFFGSLFVLIISVFFIIISKPDSTMGLIAVFAMFLGVIFTPLFGFCLLIAKNKKIIAFLEKQSSKKEKAKIILSPISKPEIKKEKITQSSPTTMNKNGFKNIKALFLLKKIYFGSILIFFLFGFTSPFLPLSENFSSNLMLIIFCTGIATYFIWLILLVIYRGAVKINKRNEFCSSIIFPFISLFIVLILYLFVAQLNRVGDGSAVDGISPNKSYLVNKLVYRFSEPKRGDVIVYVTDDLVNSEFVGRIFGISGEKIEIKNKKLFINDTEYVDTPIDWSLWTSSSSANLVLNSSEYYVDFDKKMLSAHESIDDYLKKHVISASKIRGKIY